MTPYQLYCQFLALKRHFAYGSTYDYVTYNGKVTASLDSFEKRRDKYFFYKLENKKDPYTLMVASISVNPDLWVGDLFENGEKHYREWMRRQESLSYLMEQDLLTLDDDLNSNIKVHNGSYPRLFKLYQQNKIMKETVIVMDKTLSFGSYWKKMVDDDIIFPKTFFNIEKTGRLIDVDVIKYKQLLRQRFSAMINNDAR
jgi:hypothetical protein